MKFSIFLLGVLFLSVLSIPYIDSLFPSYGIPTIIEGTVWLIVVSLLVIKISLRRIVLLFSKRTKGKR